jgi:formyltetrahydrofolate synthetase
MAQGVETDGPLRPITEVARDLRIAPEHRELFGYEKARVRLEALTLAEAAKTQDSLADNPKLRGSRRGFTLAICDLEIAAGAGFLVALAGDIVRIPGLPAHPAPERIDVDHHGEVAGLC